MKDHGHLPAVRTILHDDLHHLTEKQGPWDVVLFTGDLTFSGSRKEYEKLDAELDQIWRILTLDDKLPAPLLLAVPGNHDLTRKKVDLARASGLRNEPQIRERLWQAQDKKLRREVQRWFDCYTKWWETCKFRPREPIHEPVRPGLLPGDWSFILHKNGVRFGFVGLNTAWLDVSDDIREGDLHINVRQLHPACSPDVPTWLRQRCDLAFLLTHHPPAWLDVNARNDYQANIVSSRSFVAHMCGHLHEAIHDDRQLGGDKLCRVWQASSLFGLEMLTDGTIDRRHGYTAGEIRIENGQAQMITWPRLAFRMQSQRWQVTSDPTFLLENDLANTLAEAIPLSILNISPPPSMQVSAPARERTWPQAITESTLWRRTGTEEDTLSLARDIVRACWDIWQQGCAVIQSSDPWLDDTFPLRVIDRVDVFLGCACLDTSQALILTTAPFVYQALIAAAAASMVAAHPGELEDTTSSNEPRNTLEQIHRKYPAMVRHAAFLSSQDRTGVTSWLVHRAIALVPVLWAEQPELSLACDLQTRLDRLCSDRGNVDWANFVDLARFITIDPDTLEQRRATAVEPPLMEILHLAARAAFDPRDVDDIPIAQLGLGDDFHIPELIAALGRARWVERDHIHVLSYTCEHPVIDCVLRDLTERADTRLQRFHDRWGMDPVYRSLLASMPRRLSTAEIQPALDDKGKRHYQLPHVRFVLEHNRIRELLMGERLYQDPTLAIRELYQNALDACRYRKARQEYLERRGEGRFRISDAYHGRIEIRQDRDEHDRPYIECRDNGVGMSERELSQLFAVAGRRFVDSSEFVEERAAWRRVTPPIELHPNSQFGIGVLSYFLIADDVQIRTRRFGRNGRLADTCIEVRITSVNGLFHMRELEADILPEGGTWIRIYLRSETLPPHYEGAEPQRISSYDLLSEILWFAEFDTHVYDVARGELHWPANQIAPGGQVVSEQECGTTTHPDVWWCYRTGYEGNFLLLVDGLLTHSPDWDPEDEARTEGHPALCIINLHGAHFPKLSLDRTQIMSWAREKFEAIIREQAESLVAWPGLSMTFLWAAAKRLDDRFVQTVTELAFEREIQLPLFPARDLAEPGPCAQSDVHFRLASLGVFSGDGALLMERDIGQDLDRGLHADVPERRLRSLLTEFHIDIGGLPSLHAWRQTALEMYVEPRAIVDGSVGKYSVTLLPGKSSEQPLRRRDQLSGVRPEPIDDAMLQATSPILLMDVVMLARRHHRSLSDLLRRLHTLTPLGIRLDPRCRNPECLDINSLTDADLHILSEPRRYGNRAWLSGYVSPIHVLYTAHELGRTPSNIADRLRSLAPHLGLTLDFDAKRLDALRLDDWDWKVLSVSLDGTPPWLRGDIPAIHIKHTGMTLGCPASRVFERLQALADPLQLRVKLPCDSGTLDAIVLSTEDYRMLSHREFYNVGWPWISGSFPVTQILNIVFPDVPSVNFESAINLSEANASRVTQVYQRIEELAVLGVEPPHVTSTDLLEALRSWGSVLDIRVKELDKASSFLKNLGKYSSLLSPAGSNVSLSSSLIEFAHSIERQIVQILDALAPLALVPNDLDTALRQIDPDAGPHPNVNAALADCIHRAMPYGSAYLDDEILAEARGHLYWLSDEQIHAQLAHLRPLIEYARRHADAVDPTPDWDDALGLL